MKPTLLKTFFITILFAMGAVSTITSQETTITKQNIPDTNNIQTEKESGENEKFEKYFSVVHYYDQFQKPSTLNWHLTSMQAKFKSKDITYMGYINYGQVLNKAADPFREINMQYRLDVYPVFGDNNYAYLSYAYSGSDIFPVHQARAILYHQFGKGYETSLGMYYMMWEKPFYIYTGSIAKYYKSYWFSFRPYLQFEEGTLYQSYLLFARKYFDTPDDYLNLMIGYGSSPDNQAYLYNIDNIYSLESFNFQLNYQKSIEQWLFLLGAGLKIEEYEETKTRNHLHFELGISYKL
ncbi:MAG: YaiO family outer membrane beta-barrel protein [Bacteroidales bacterium]